MSTVTRSPGLALFFAVLAGAGACGDDGPGRGSGDRDGLFDEPADFQRGDCGGELDGVDPGGIWHVDMDFGDGSNSASAVRIDPEGDAGFVAFMFGSETDDVRLSADDLFVRREVAINGEEDVIAIDLCRMDGDGVLTGEIASCYDGECVVGAIAAHPVAPIDEPEAENLTVVSEWSGSPEWDTGEVTI
ncbi:MAG TPA: hypothetical protein VNO33_24435, partial [Kofleriaceae bacterium]|nr:hypothetical protein [Kofleriaceae bacterium]